MPSVLIVDDDVKIVKLLNTYFEKDHYTVHTAYDGIQALQKVRDKKTDIVVLDIMLPGMDGFEVCKAIRRDNNIPIIMLTARDEETDRLIGLEIGADDYVTKPFSPREVIARAKAILRRTQNSENKDETIRVGSILIDVKRHEVSKEGTFLELTPTEFKMVELLANHRGRVLSRLQIVEQVQGFAFDGYERTIDAHIKNLRRKIEDDPKKPTYIQTVYGVGYKMVGEVNA